jgi:hypothetical protein
LAIASCRLWIGKKKTKRPLAIADWKEQKQTKTNKNK